MGGLSGYLSQLGEYAITAPLIIKEYRQIQFLALSILLVSLLVNDSLENISI